MGCNNTTYTYKLTILQCGSIYKFQEGILTFLFDSGVSSILSVLTCSERQVMSSISSRTRETVRSVLCLSYALHNGLPIPQSHIGAKQCQILDVTCLTVHISLSHTFKQRNDSNGKVVLHCISFIDCLQLPSKWSGCLSSSSAENKMTKTSYYLVECQGSLFSKSYPRYIICT